MVFEGLRDAVRKLSGMDRFRRLSRLVTVEEAVSVFMVSEGLKLGALVMSASDRAVKVLRSLAGSEDLYLEVRSDEFGRGVFLASDPERLDLLDSEGSFYGSSGESVGRFLGYDEDSVEFYVEAMEEDRIPAQELHEKVEELLDDGLLEVEEVRFLALVGYVPVPDEEHVLDAVKKGRDRYRRLRDTEVSDLVEIVLDQSMWNT